MSTDSGRQNRPFPTEVSTDPARPSPPGRAPSASACEPYRELIVEALGRGRNAMAIWQDLVDDHGFAARYASVRRFVVTLRGSAPAEARVVITTAPGEEGQVDYGDGPMVRDREHGQVPAHAALRPDARLLAQVGAAAGVAIERADLGRAPRARVSPAGRHRPRHRPRQSERRRAHAGHLRPRAQSALSRRARALRRRRAAVPRRRSRSQRERSKPASATRRRRRCRGLRFETLDEAQAYLDRWETRWADTRIHGTTKRQVAVMFAEEQPALGPLPLEPFRYYRFGERTVHLDGCVEVEAAYYGAPPGWIGQRVQVQWNDLHVRLLDSEDRPAAARASARAARLASHRTTTDRPARTPANDARAAGARARAPARTSAPSATHIHQHEGAAGVRRILGVLALAKKHGPAVVDDAAKAALELGVPTYRFLRRYLERRPPVPLTLRQVDPLIRQLTLYRDLIDRKTGDPL